MSIKTQLSPTLSGAGGMLKQVPIGRSPLNENDNVIVKRAGCSLYPGKVGASAAADTDLINVNSIVSAKNITETYHRNAIFKYDKAVLEAQSMNGYNISRVNTTKRAIKLAP